MRHLANLVDCPAEERAKNHVRQIKSSIGKSVTSRAAAKAAATVSGRPSEHSGVEKMSSPTVQLVPGPALRSAARPRLGCQAEKAVRCAFLGGTATGEMV